MADYDILENWEGPTTENKDWRKKLDKGIREDLSEGMIESPISEGPGKYDWLSDVGDYITDDFLEDLGGVGDVLGDMEWGKVGINSLLNTPEMLLDLATFWPQAGWQAGKFLSGEEPENFLENKPWIPYDETESWKEGKGIEAEKIAQESLEALGAIPLYRYLYNRSPQIAQTIARNWMPFMHGVATDFGSDLKNYYRKIKKPIKLTKGAPQKVLSSLKNALWSPGTARSLGQGAITGGIGTFLSTLLHSKPAYGALDDPGGANYQGSYADRIRDNIDFSAPSPSLIQDSDPVIFDEYVSERIREPRDERRVPGPWNEFRG